MGKEIKIVVPSHLRFDRVKTTKAIANCIICVPESQAELYREYNKNNEVVAHPDSIIGLTPKRQWILEHFGDVFQVDDDCTQMARVYTGPKEKTRIPKRTAYDLIQQAGNIANDMGIFLFAFSKSPMPTAYNPLKPIRMSGTVMGGGFGVLTGSKLHFNTDLVLTEDYWISGLNAHYHRMTYIDERFTFKFSNTFANKGGCASYRTTHKELEDTLKLKEYFGDAIQLKKDTHLAKVKIEGSRTMRIPF